MSTRSGKRIHSSVDDDDPVTEDTVVQTERKTRSKKQKENLEASSKKRNNYVRYPKEEDSNVCEGDEKKRRTRRYTLKEHNTDIPDGEDNNEVKSVRKSRRGKKAVDVTEKDDNDIGDDTQDSEGRVIKYGKSKRETSLEDTGKVINGIGEDTESNINTYKNDKKKTKKDASLSYTEFENVVIDNVKSEIKTVKKDRKKKRVSLEHAGNTNTTVNNDMCASAEESEVKAVIKDKKKSKKKRNHKKTSVEPDDKENIDTEVVIKKKVGKKKKKSNSMIDEVVEHNKSNMLDKTNMSIDSFHSAAGSPVNRFTDDIAPRSSSVQAGSYDTENRHSSANEKAFAANSTFEKEPKSKRKLNIQNDSSVQTENIDTEDKINSTFEKTSTLNNTFERENRRKSITKIGNSVQSEVIETEEHPNSTFDKICSLNNTFEKESKNQRKSITKKCNSVQAEPIDTEDKINSTFDERNAPNSTFEKASRHRRKAVIKKANSGQAAPIHTHDEINSTLIETAALNDTFEKESKNRRKSSIKNSTFDVMEMNCDMNGVKNSTFETHKSPKNDTFEKIEPEKRFSKAETKPDDEVSSLNNTFDRTADSELVEPKKRSSHVETILDDKVVSLNSTFDNTPNGQIPTLKSLDTTFDKHKLNTTFEKPSTDKRESGNEIDSKKSSLISSDGTSNVTFDRSNDSRISITSDESRTENILNHTPMLIESSIDESHVSLKDTPDKPETLPIPEKPEEEPLPLKREGTFTKDTAESPKRQETPAKRKSLPSPGFTPFPFMKSSQKEKCMLNVTRSIEKSLGRSSLAETVPKQTRVMFCSPVNNPAVVTQMKGKVIKSNLKGSNKSFVFDDAASQAPRGTSRKRSLTHGDVETRHKRKRLADEMQHSVDRLSRPRTLSAAAKLPDPATPSKKATPSKPKPERLRTKLPNFAALHQKQFEKMESLDECQERKAKRARQLLTPTGSVNIIERTSPKDTPTNPAPSTREPTIKLTPSKGPLESLNPGYTRFGFKLNIDANPFSVTSKKPDGIPKEKRCNGVLRQTTCLALPSLAGATASRRDVAKNSVMREKSFTEKRDVKRKENRTVIKGVRTNRRFELQMKMRNINA